MKIADLQPGAILGWQSSGSFIGEAITAFEGSPWMHVGLVVQDPMANRLLVLEDGQPDIPCVFCGKDEFGVTIVDAHERLKDGRAWACQPRYPLTITQAIRLWQVAREQDSKDIHYGVIALLGLGRWLFVRKWLGWLPWQATWNKPPQESGLVCSTFAASVLEWCGLWNGDELAMTPADVMAPLPGWFAPQKVEV